MGVSGRLFGGEGTKGECKLGCTSSKSDWKVCKEDEGGLRKKAGGIGGAAGGGKGAIGREGGCDMKGCCCT